MSQNGAVFNARSEQILRRAEILRLIDPSRPVLIAGPTASGKSALALEAARLTGGPVVNADAIQVFSDWRVLTARPGPGEVAAHPHALYGHVPGTTAYSVGHWLRDVAPFLEGSPPVIVGGTGLYFTALTEGLAEIPPTPAEVRREADEMLEAEGLDVLLRDLDPETVLRIDQRNPARVQRAWEVMKATGRGLASWQDETGPPLLDVAAANAILIEATPDELNPRIAARLDIMLAEGALDEAEANAGTWHPALPSAKAIGAAELVAHVRGEMSLGDARAKIEVLTRQYAKRQRTWFRARFGAWTKLAFEA